MTPKMQNRNKIKEPPVFEPPKVKKIYDVSKRGFDIVLSTIALVGLSPVFLVTAIAIKLEDHGNVFYCQTRLTKNAREFKMYKFRSMHMNADQKLSGLLPQNEMSGPTFKIKNDPRITKVGRVIRRLSIDELPQLINVLRGDMSIVGPRPPLPREVEKYTEYQLHRLDVKTGLACYHECQGRSLISDFDRWVEMDLQYIRDRSIWTDTKIIAATIVAVLTGKGAE